MARERFPLTSDQLEVLVAFSERKGLADLAESLAKDPSVVSRHLQRIAEVAPVLEKVNGRWALTLSGAAVVAKTRDFLAAIDDDVRTVGKTRDPWFATNAALVVINAQKGLGAANQGERSNADAEANIARLLAKWRSEVRPVIHVRHVSANPKSPFAPGSKGAEFIEGLGPAANEEIFDKTKASAFAETTLAAALEKRGIETLVLVGFTASDCIDATARSSSALGFTTAVVGDATAIWAPPSDSTK